MPLETPITYITDLNTANPTSGDGLVQGDDHLRGIKSALKNTFSAFTGAAVAASEAELNAVAHTGQINAQDGTAGAPSHSFKTDATTGFYKGARTGQTAIAGTLRGDGAREVGEYGQFACQPPGYVANGASGGRWLLCNGLVYNNTDYPDLAAALGSTYGAGGAGTFRVPNLTDTGRFLRSFSTGTNPTGIAVAQSNLLGTHAHTGTTASAGAHTHTVTVSDTRAWFVPVGSPDGVSSTNSGVDSGVNVYPSPSGVNSRQQAVSVLSGNITATVDSQGAHTHTFTTDATGGAETRPEAMTCYVCIKA